MFKSDRDFRLELSQLKEAESRAILAEAKYQESIRRIRQLESEIKSLENQLSQYRSKSNLKLKISK